MFSKNNVKESNGKASKNGSSNAATINLIGIGTSIDGEVKSDGDVRIDGKIRGMVISKAKIVIGSTGVVEGDVVCLNADISGKVEGKIDVEQLLFLKGTANINGDIQSAKLVVEAGAKFNGSCRMGAQPVKHDESIEHAQQTLKKAAS